MQYGKINRKEKTFQGKNSKNITTGFSKDQLHYQWSDSEINDEGFEYSNHPIFSFSLRVKMNFFSGNSTNSFFSQAFSAKTLTLYDLFCEWRSDC